MNRITHMLMCLWCSMIQVCHVPASNIAGISYCTYKWLSAPVCCLDIGVCVSVCLCVCVWIVLPVEVSQPPARW